MANSGRPSGAKSISSERSSLWACRKLTAPAGAWCHSTRRLEALKAWKTNWPDAGLDDFIFPSQKLKYVGKGSWLARGKMVPYDTDLSKPVGTWKKSWASAQKAAGVKARIHDLHHHANTLMTESGVPISTLKSISGWMTQEMAEHYTHVRDTSKRKAVDALGATNVGMIQ